MSTQPLEVVWFKRDLRVVDHAPLAAAASRGPVLPLYVIEPSVLAAPDFDALHWRFIATSLHELRESLAALGQPLVVRRGEVVAVLSALVRKHRVARLWAHEETGNALTYARDLAVHDWARANGVEFSELPQHGVVRRLKHRDGWSHRWQQRMGAPLVPAPEHLETLRGIDPGSIPDAPELGLQRLAPAVTGPVALQPGGSRAAVATLGSFLAGRGAGYHRELSSPLTAFDACSRLSPHLAWGTLSVRSVVHAVDRELAADAAVLSRRALQAFRGRLHWHCHFIQKLESEPAIEHRCFNRAYEDLRGAPDAARLAAWQSGLTGYPFVDACIRALQQHGWLNFRMRAMLVSFAAHHLWLDWRAFRDFLARQFADYEPGIHYSQLQMQSATTGINTMRIYNPVKQALEQDPDGEFVRRYVPELAGLPGALIHAPWELPASQLLRAGVSLGRQYPKPVVDHVVAARLARDRIASVRSSELSRREAARVFDRHGSRRGPVQGGAARKARERRLAGQDDARYSTKATSRRAADARQPSLFDSPEEL